MTELVGRQVQLAALGADLERARGGRGSLVLLSGDPGIGKTALAEATASRARDLSMKVGWGRCLEDTGTPPFWPWLEVLRGLGLRLERTVASDSQERRFAYFEELAELLKERGGLVVLDDLHWADEPSLVFLRFLAGDLPQARLLVLGCYRGGELTPGAPLTRALPELLRERSARHVTLAGLTRDEVARLGAGANAQRIHSRSGGNPFFAIELVRTVEAGADPAHLPETVRHAVRGRLARLPAKSRLLLNAASVIGRDFETSVLADVTSEPPTVLLRDMQPAVAARLAVEAAGSYRFEHDLVRETIYEDLPAAQRVELHARVGAVLEHRYAGDSEPHLAELAEHSFRSSAVSGAAKAVDLAERAGAYAMSRGAFEEAARLYRMALDALARVGANDLRRAELLLEMVRALDLSDQGSAAIDVAMELSHVASHLADTRMAAAAALVGEGAFTIAADSIKLVEICESALQLLNPEKEPALRSRVLSQLSIALHFSESERRSGFAAQALELAEKSGDMDALVAALHAQQLAPWGSRTPEQRLAGGDRLLELGRESGNRRAELWGHYWRMSALFEMGDMAGLDAAIESYGQVAEEIKDPSARWRRALSRGARAQMTGRFAEAERCAQEVRASALAAQNRTVQIMRAALTAAIHRTQGHYGEALAVMDECQRLGFNPTFPWIRACALAQLGRPEAAAEFQRLVAGAVGIGARSHTWPIMMLHYAETAVLVGGDEEARAGYAMLLPYANRNAVAAAGTAAGGGSISRYLGMLAGFLGMLPEAVAHYRFAIEMNERQGALPYVAFSEYELANVLIRRSSRGDRAEALILLGRARDRAAALDMEGLLTDVSAALERARGGSAPYAPLTAREAEVAALVAGGLTNKEISQRLHLSTRTAENHVENICNKLGFSSRSQVAAWAVEHSLSATTASR